ncbi:PRP39 pre-mRNA processing factor 39 [Parelaphostrongylus tenuis]|uniref:PRP39 pre-mRNA processing factor 39 n=1 Tax=Parelaphostrongylus tenuis TaxID=148309 RepID=A0AAD5QFW6_PARTN|nr:PRP39 pre-mRNA processing factor 39 [Parelaphostrongylus tenuis]
MEGRVRSRSSSRSSRHRSRRSGRRSSDKSPPSHQDRSRSRSRSHTRARSNSSDRQNSRSRRSGAEENSREGSVTRRSPRSRSPSPANGKNYDSSRSTSRRDRDQSSSSRSSSGDRGSRSRSRSCTPDFERNEALRDSWAALRTQPNNFDAWIILLTQADQSNDIKLARDMYNRFLKKYPYCYGFWKKYADMERRHQHFSDALNVWERGILAIPLSIDLWLGFIVFMRELAPQSDRGIEKLRELYERAVSVAGHEFHSDRLWQDYIAWEEAQGEWRRVAEIYDRLLRIPTAMYKSHMERFEAIVNMCNPYDLLSEEEFNDVFEIVRRKCNLGVDQIVSNESVMNADGAGTDIAEAPNFFTSCTEEDSS